MISYKISKPSLMAQHNIQGKNGEDLAAQYLRKKGYQILQRNWRHKRLEIDIIAQNENTLIIVEVKTRSSDIITRPEDAIDHKKIKHLLSAAQAYVNYHQIDLDIRFDVISIILNNKLCKLEHIEDAFYPPIN